MINPEALRRTIEGGMLHSLSRTLREEVRFEVAGRDRDGCDLLPVIGDPHDLGTATC